MDGSVPPMRPSAYEGPDAVQLLSPEGELVVHPGYSLSVSDEELRSIYRDLALVRRLDIEATALQRQGELGLWAPCLGQEAAQIGAARAARPTDMIFPTYREHGMAWLRGVDPVELLGLFRGTTNGGWNPLERRFGLYTIVIGAQTLHAVGWAMAAQRTSSNEATLVCFGDGASSQGDVNEAFVFASVYNAPVVFFLQNNQWAISEPSEKQTRIPLYQRSRGFGFPGIRVDGNDVLAVQAVVARALEAAREGQGPILVEAFTYRMGAHTTSDDPTRYRLSAETEKWRLRDPIERVRAHLLRNGKADQDFMAEVEHEAEELAVRIRAAVRELPIPKPLSMYDNVYEETNNLLADERAQMKAYLESFQ